MRFFRELCVTTCFMVGCADGPQAKFDRQCPGLPSQMAPDERVFIDITTAPDRTVADTLTASIAAAGGFMETLESTSDTSFSATVDRIGAGVVCRHELVIFASEPLIALPTN